MTFFDGLQQKLGDILKKLRGAGRITEKDISEVTREIRLALLEADVNYKAVRGFIETVKEKALGADILQSLSPGQQVIKIVHGELVSLLGGDTAKLAVASNKASIYVLVGLQGSGKTTTSAKLANHLRKQGKRPMLAACDIYRPAAIKQLQVLGKQLEIEVYAEDDTRDVVEIIRNAIKVSEKKMYDTIIVDTAGRLHIDDEMMAEISSIKEKIKPTEVLLVIDAMTGQDAVNSAKTFDDRIGIDGMIITKLDGDTRGGAALSAKFITGRPLKFACTGEKLSDIEVFHPDRMASRILGMGDVLSLIERAQENFDLQKAKELEEKIRKQSFTLEDFLGQLHEIKKMGSLANMIQMIPGLQAKGIRPDDLDEDHFKRIEAVINSMTAKERLDPDVLNSSRRKRIAAGSGTNVQTVNKVISDFENLKRMMKLISSGRKPGGKFGKFNIPI